MLGDLDATLLDEKEGGTAASADHYDGARASQVQKGTWEASTW